MFSISTSYQWRGGLTLFLPLFYVFLVTDFSHYELRCLVMDSRRHTNLVNGIRVATQCIECTQMPVAQLTCGQYPQPGIQIIIIRDE